MVRIHFRGILLFLFIPLVLFLFLKHPFGVIIGFVIAIVIMISHRLVAIPFMNRFKKSGLLRKENGVLHVNGPLLQHVHDERRAM